MPTADRVPLHQCYCFGGEDVDPFLVFVKFLVRNPQYARARHADCDVNLYVVDRPMVDSLICPPRWLSRRVTTMGEVRAAAAAITGEDFSRPPLTPEQVAARKARKLAKKAAKAK